MSQRKAFPKCGMAYAMPSKTMNILETAATHVATNDLEVPIDMEIDRVIAATPPVGAGVIIKTNPPTH